MAKKPLMYAFVFGFTSQYFSGEMTIRAENHTEAIVFFEECWNTKKRPVPVYWIKSKSEIIGGENTNG